MARHPFGARESGRDPFPSFAETMRMGEGAAVSDDGRDGGDDDSSGSLGDGEAALNWSIDSLATLLPVAFSPLSAQKRPQPPRSLSSASSARRRRRRARRGSSTSVSSAASTESGVSFFDDEAQFRVLRTPASVIEQEQLALRVKQQVSVDAMATTTEYARWRSPDSARWRELHRRCVDTMQLCEARLQERQHKLARLPIPASKITLKRGRGGASPFATTPFRRSTCGVATPEAATSTPVKSRPREPLTPVVATRLSFGSVDLSPIPADSAEKQRARSLVMSDSIPFTSPSARGAGDLSDAGDYLSPPLSSIAEHSADVLTPSFASLSFTSHIEDEEKDQDAENKENEPSRQALNTSDESSPSLKTMSFLQDESSPFSSPFTPPSGVSVVTTTTSEEAAQDEARGITRRQLSFVAAIEEEAQVRDAKKSTKCKQRTTGGAKVDEHADCPTTVKRRNLTGLPTPPATSTAAIYKEARSLGITEPHAQWEYVRLIRRHTATSGIER